MGLEEQTPLPALDRWPPPLPWRPGLRERQEVEYGRPGTGDLFAAFAVGSGKVWAPCSHRHPTREVRHFLRTLRAHDPESRWQLIGDTASSHTQQAVLDGCAEPCPQVTLPWLPAQGSGRKQGEIWFSLLRRKCVRRARVRSTPDLRNLMPRFVKTWNTHFAQPCEWTSTGKPLAVAPPHDQLLAA